MVYNLISSSISDKAYVTDENTRRYFMPALLVRFVAAILLGVLYQFYYGGGDTFSYHTHGSSHIYAAFQDSIVKGISMLFASGEYIPETFEYASKIWFYRDPGSYFVIKVSAFFDLLTFNTYSATALFFAATSFSGMWALYQVFYRQYKKLHFWLALTVLFIPSVVFWGSGILKDSLTLSALGWVVFIFYKSIIKGRLNLFWLIIFAANILVLYHVKIYIILTIVPSLILWWLFLKLQSIKSMVLRIIVAPVLIISGCAIIYVLLDHISQGNTKYALDNIAETARITAYDIGFYTGRDAGSGYSLGDLDGSIQSLLMLFPQAVNASLFRPYLWEVNGPIMLLSAFEAAGISILTLLVLLNIFFTWNFKPLQKPLIISVLIFAVVFAFAVGVSTFNFGTLARYKIPLLPFYCSALVILMHHFTEKVVKNHPVLPAENNVL